MVLKWPLLPIIIVMHMLGWPIFSTMAEMRYNEKNSIRILHSYRVYANTCYEQSAYITGSLQG
jgi:hypothetical protein